MDPFTIDSLDIVNWAKEEFAGTMVSDGIFPEFREALTLQKDRSLGFRTTTPGGGFAMYDGKGTLKTVYF